jgi:glycerate dehydrogenase
MKIVVLDGRTLNLGDLSWDGFRALGKLTVFDRTPVDEIPQRAGEAEIVLTNKTVLNRETIRKLTHLQYIGVLATGHNVVNVAAAAKRGIVVTNVPAYSTASVAEHVFAFLLEEARRISFHAHTVRKGRWCDAPDFCYWLHPLTELAGRTIGLVGYGHIGKAIAQRAVAFGMPVLCHTRTPPAAAPEGVRFCDLDTLFRDSDIVSLHCPLTPETDKFVNAARLAQMKRSAWLNNTARGGLVDDLALADALNSGKLAGAMLDVLTEEPPLPEQPLLRARNCLITPHHAWATREARTRLMEVALANLKAFLAKQPQNVVPNPEAPGVP